MTVVCVDVPGCEGGAILSTAQGGTVIFFSMATSFSSAALSAEGLAADVTMLVGNGYVPGHAELALDLIRATPALRALFERRIRHEERPAMTGKLNLDPAIVRQARELARRAGQPVTDLARTHTTVSVERAVLRLAGLDGADDDGMPWVNRLTDAIRESVGLEHGVALPVWDAMLAGDYPDLRMLAVDATAGLVKFRLPAGHEADASRETAARSVKKGISLIDAQRVERDRMLAATSNPPMPWIYLIVATGRYLRGHPAGPGGGAGGRGHHRGDQVDRAVTARLRARGRHPGGLRRDLRHAGELPADAVRLR